jgi:hypothetical protein
MYKPKKKAPKKQKKKRKKKMMTRKRNQRKNLRRSPKQTQLMISHRVRGNGTITQHLAVLKQILWELKQK